MDTTHKPLFGGKEVDAQTLLILVQDGVQTLIEAFKWSVTTLEEAKCIERATISPIFSEVTAHIEAAIQAKQAIKHPLLFTIVCEEVWSKSTSPHVVDSCTVNDTACETQALRSEVQSVKTRLDNQIGGCSEQVDTRALTELPQMDIRLPASEQDTKAMLPLPTSEAPLYQPAEKEEARQQYSIMQIECAD